MGDRDAQIKDQIRILITRNKNLHNWKAPEIVCHVTRPRLTKFCTRIFEVMKT